MNTNKLLRHLARHGCYLSRHGGNHDTWRRAGFYVTSVPRHKEVDFRLAREICRDLDIPPPLEK